MKTKLLGTAIAFSLIFILSVIFLSRDPDEKTSQDVRSEQIVAVNEISQLIQNGDTELAIQKADLLQNELRSMTVYDTPSVNSAALCCIAVIFTALLLGYVYINILLPFEKMKGFSAEIAKGNFDVPLEYNRSDYFGAFTWAFDSMRKEITRSRANEREAIENNKTVIATLSHDIKTPIASIRAYTEGLEANLDVSPERRARYLAVIMRKCDEVTSLTNDLFLHSISDMGMLQMQPEDIDIIPFLEQAISEISAERSDVIFHKPDFSAVISADKKRIIQAAENLINNARKYAHTDIEISFTKSENELQIHFCDSGCGIPDEDLPFITDKFYRGKNCGNENGSGLGLYIVRYIAEQSGGALSLINREKGLEAVITLPVSSFCCSDKL